MTHTCEWRGASFLFRAREGRGKLGRSRNRRGGSTSSSCCRLLGLRSELQGVSHGQVLTHLDCKGRREPVGVMRESGLSEARLHLHPSPSA